MDSKESKMPMVTMNQSR